MLYLQKKKHRNLVLTKVHPKTTAKANEKIHRVYTKTRFEPKPSLTFDNRILDFGKAKVSVGVWVLLY